MTPIKKILKDPEENSQKHLAESFKSDFYRLRDDEREFENSPYKKKENRTTLPGLNKINHAQLSNRGEILKSTKPNFYKENDQ